MLSNTIYVVVEEEDDFGFHKTKVIAAYWSKELALEKCIGTTKNRSVQSVPIMDGFEKMTPRFDPIKPTPNPYVLPDIVWPPFDPLRPSPNLDPRFPTIDPINPLPHPGPHFPSFDPLAKKPGKPNSGFDI